MDQTPTPNVKALAGIVAVVALLAVVGATMMGNQVSTILSTVGSAIPVNPDGGNADGDTPVDEGGGQVADAGGAVTPPDLLIIRTGSLEIEVADIPAAVASAGERIAGFGGYVGSSEESAADVDTFASVVYRIPAARWDDATSAVRAGAARVLHSAVATEEVTNQVIDLGARITNLRATEGSFQAIMAGATRIDDVLAVQKELTAVRGEIERLVAQREALEERAAFGTLTVVFRLPAPPAVTVVQRGWDPGAEVDRSVGTLVKIGQRGVSVAIWLAIVGLPVALGLVLGLAIVAAVARQANRLVGRLRARSEAG